VPFVPQQLSVMCGIRDPTAPKSVATANADGMMCTRRLLGLPVFVTVTSAFCGAYRTVRNSHELVTTIFGHAENGMRTGVELASPVTGKVADLLETPLKVVDGAVCVGLDFVEERVPSVKLPPSQIYANAKDGVRNIFTSALETLRLLFGGSKDQIEDSVANEITQGIRKMSS